ncbi:MAG: two-component sensor histidine kinase, partial [Bacteroidia bacterium]|nr:two-component sensor histidine kinase [Bacteroidia bacterium]
MKIRTQLTILFTVFTATILLVFACIIYFSAKENREKEFYSLLKKEALTKANLLFNAKIETQTLQNIYRNNREILNEVEVAIYDSSFTLLYHDAVDIDFVKETPEMITEVYQNNEKYFY